MAEESFTDGFIKPILVLLMFGMMGGIAGGLLMFHLKQEEELKRFECVVIPPTNEAEEG